MKLIMEQNNSGQPEYQNQHRVIVDCHLYSHTNDRLLKTHEYKQKTCKNTVVSGAGLEPASPMRSCHLN